MATVVDHLLEFFSSPDGSQEREALREQVRAYINSDAGAELDLSDELQDGRNRFADLYNGGEFDPKHAPHLRMLGEVIKAVQDVHTEQLEARAELDTEFASLAADIGGPETPAADQDDQAPDGGAGGEQEPEAEQTDQAPAETEEAKPEQEPEPAGAFSQSPSARVRPAAVPVRLPSASALNAHRPPQAAGSLGEGFKRRYSVIAAADVPRTTSGSALSMRELAEATNRRFQSMPLGQKGVAPRRGGVALIKRTFDRNVQTYGDRRDVATIDRVADERNLPGGSLIAAAQSHRQALTAAGCCTTMSNDVWCAPSETDYSLCPPLATLEGMLDLPTVPINHGGIRYPVWDQAPADWHGQVVPNTCEEPLDPDHFTQPENAKVCIEGPCPTWDEKRLNVAYLCVEGDILRERGFPELTQRFIEDALVQHAHFMNHTYLSELYAESDALPAFDVSASGIGSVSDSVMDRLGLLIAWMRERYKMAMNATLEGVLPAWFKTYIKADIARKNNRPFSSVTDAEVDDLFAAYATRIQWVYDTEGIVEDASLGNGTPTEGGLPMPGEWPGAVEMVFFPSGSWVLGQQDVITLDAMYDSTKLSQNKYTSLFLEEGWLLLNRCNRSFRVRLEGLCRNGGVGAPVTITCPETPAAPAPEPPPEGQALAAASAGGRSGQRKAADNSSATKR